MIVIFYFFPDIERTTQNIIHNEFSITIADVPSTRQESSGEAAPPPPVLPNIFLPEEDSLEVVLQDINIPAGKNASGNGTVQGLAGGSAEGSSSGSSGKGDSYIAGAFVPRQILEVFPEKTKGRHTGLIHLSLRIGADGRVISHRIVQNTTGSDECLANSIKAAYKSKWSPISGVFSGEYWVEKKYEFK